MEKIMNMCCVSICYMIGCCFSVTKSDCSMPVSSVLHCLPAAAAAAAKSLQSGLTLCDPTDGSLPGSSIPGILQARTLAFPSPMHESEKWKWSRSVMFNSSWPHGLQPTRLLRPWDFPGNSTGVSCHCLLHYLPEFAQIHIHWISDAIQPSHPLLPSSSFAFNLPQHEDFFQWIGN